MQRWIRTIPCLSVAAWVSGPVAAADSGQRVLWRFRTDGRTIGQFVTVGPEGTIYTGDNAGTYALTPAGELRWFTTAAAAQDGAGARPISIGFDGTIHTGVGIVGDSYAPVVALNPEDGSTRWMFLTPNRDSILTGPNVGPDGNVYASQDSVVNQGLGVFSLDPEGNLRWAHAGDPPFGFGETVLSDSDIEFGADRLHTGIVRSRSGGNPVVYTFTLDGQQLWQTYNLRPHITSQPAMDPMNRLIVTWGQTGMRALSPDFKEEWFLLHPNGVSLVKRPAIDADGVIYSGDLVGVDLWAINPDGTTRWVLPQESNAGLRTLGIAPTGRVIVAGGSSAETGWVRGYAAEDGGLLWQVDLPPENGLAQFVSAYEPAFSGDATVVYVTTQFVGGSNDFGYVYAIRTGDGASGVLANVEVVTGDLLFGGIAELESSDDARLRTRSGFGQSLTDLHNMTMIVDAATEVDSPTTLRLRIESRIDAPSGAARVRLWNWNTGQFVHVGSHAIDSTERVEVIGDIPATNHVNSSGAVRLSIKHTVFVPIFAFNFESSLDQVRIEVE